MTDLPPQDDAEAIAAKRYGTMQLVRVMSLGLVIMGISITQGVLPAPYLLGAVIGAVGILGFFFVPNLLARRWKDADRAKDDETPEE